MKTTKAQQNDLSVVIPAYNAASWLPKSVPRVSQAMKNAGIRNGEIIIVDDGSSDETAKVAKSLVVDYPVLVVSQANSGRFKARETGVKRARYDFILLIDTRIYIGKKALAFVFGRLNTTTKAVWTSHVYIDREGNPYARFWEALTFIAWRRYFARPREISYGLKDFDYYPKGTTCFIAPKQALITANKWFLNTTKNDKASNDDTLLIRKIAEDYPINLSPEFYCRYHARTNLRQYCKHVFHRGKVFVDGFLRRDGNRFFWLLVIFLVASILVPVGLIIFPQFIFPALVIAGLAWFFELLLSLILGVPLKDALSLFILSPLFAVVYGAGIWTAVVDIYVRRRT